MGGEAKERYWNCCVNSGRGLKDGNNQHLLMLSTRLISRRMRTWWFGGRRMGVKGRSAKSWLVWSSDTPFNKSRILYCGEFTP